MKNWLRAAAGRLGFVVHRWPATRFEGIPDALQLLRAAGFAPAVIIDGGANHGTWTQLARQCFPAATIHMVEPQAACRASLEAITRADARTTFSPVALTAPAVSSVAMLGDLTGAFVVPAGTAGATTVRAATLDELFAGLVTPADCTFLKLDLEGHEVAALSGGERLLPHVEVILAEFRLFRPFDIPHAETFTELFRFLDAHGFDLYDVAALHGRARDQRLRLADGVFVRRGTPLARDTNWD